MSSPEEGRDLTTSRKDTAGVPRLAARQFATFASFTEDGCSVVTLHED